MPPAALQRVSSFVRLRQSFRPRPLLVLTLVILMVGVVSIGVLHTFRKQETPRGDLGRHVAPVDVLQQPGLSTYDATRPVRDLEQVASEIVAAVNVEREQVGANALTRSAQLENSAAAKLQHMLEHDYWAHVSPDGVEPWTFVSDAGYQYLRAGENLAKDFGSARDVVLGWMGSKAHRETMLDPDFRDLGISISFNARGVGLGGMLVVAHFGQPQK